MSLTDGGAHQRSCSAAASTSGQLGITELLAQGRRWVEGQTPPGVASLRLHSLLMFGLSGLRLRVVRAQA